MSHSYSTADDHSYGYGGSGQYGLSQQSYHPYTSQMLAPYGQQHHTSLHPDAPSLGSHYASSQSVHGQYSQHAMSQAYPYALQYASPSKYQTARGYLSPHDSLREPEIEGQDSCNEHTMISEPVLPPLEGFPDVREFDQLMQSYVEDLSVKKQDKALIHARRARNIRTVLLDPKDTAIESAQFRFWVKKMFRLEPDDNRVPESKRLVCHEGKPVAIREKLFKILTRAHQQCQHGGRDKTSAQVRRIYSWVPKELISRFVKICPTCQVRRGGSRLTPPSSRRSSPKPGALTLPGVMVSPDSRRDSLVSRSGMGRPQQEYTHVSSSGWGPGSHHMPGQYAHSSLSPMGLGTLPRSGMSMAPPSFEYGAASYTGTHTLPEHHHRHY